MDISLHKPQAPPPSPPDHPPELQVLIPLTLLMEKVGDSETTEVPLDQYPMLSLLEDGHGEDDEEDTESSCGTCSHECLKEKYYGDQRDHDGEAEDFFDDDSLRGGLSPEFGMMSSEWCKREEEGIRVLLDSREEDRLFWEACLANRYPYD